MAEKQFERIMRRGTGEAVAKALDLRLELADDLI